MRTIPAHGPATCEHCGNATDHPRWRRYDVGEYVGLCLSCDAELDRTFTTMDAVLHASAIVFAHQIGLPVVFRTRGAS